MVRFWLNRVLGTLRRLGFVHVDAVLKVVAADPPHGRVSLPGGWTVVREYDSVRLVRSAEGGPDRVPATRQLLLPGAAGG